MKKFLLILLAIFACNVAVNATVDGDVNGDGNVTAADVTALYDYLLNADMTYYSSCDVNHDGDVTSADITYVYNILLGIPNTNPDPNVEEITVNGVTFNMVFVEGGTYMMGDPNYQNSPITANDGPVHQVTVSSFSIGQTEVTQELWVAVMGYNPSYFNGCGNPDYYSNHDPDYGINLQRPVEYVLFQDCEAFIAQLNQLTGKTFRLPTEAEWEFAARGGNKSQGFGLYAGSDNLSEVAWYYLNIPSNTMGTEGFGSQTVGTKAPNELDLYDMTGNVYELCQDWLGDYPTEPQVNPTGAESGTYHVARGGAWSLYSKYMQLTYRWQQRPDNRGNSVGFRLAMSAE